MVYVSSVPTEHLDIFDGKLHESLRRIVKEGVDLNRMRMVIDRDERQVLFRFMPLFQHFIIVFKLRSKVESSGGDTFSSTMIANFLYGRSDGSQIEEALNEIKFYNTLRTWSSEQWADLIQRCAHRYCAIFIHLVTHYNFQIFCYPQSSYCSRKTFCCGCTAP